MTEGTAAVTQVNTPGLPDTDIPEQPYLSRRQHWITQLDRHALMQPQATALRFVGNTVTWAQLHGRVSALADALHRRGVGYGDRVMVLMLNRTEFVEAVLALSLIHI